MSTAALSSTGNSVRSKSETMGRTKQLWKINDERAQKSGPHGSMTWVQRVKPATASGSQTRNKALTEKPTYKPGVVFSGEWENNKKSGYGIQVWPNGNKYEGQWVNGMREGTGAFYVLDSATKKHKKQYHGSWRANFKDGLGVFFYQNGDRYEGSWVHGHRTGKGSHFYASGDVYVGDWIEDQRSGWGRLTKANGDQYEGQWLSDRREGQGQYFFRKTGRLFDGEWVNDTPKTGVYTDVQIMAADQLQQQLNPLTPNPLPADLLPGADGTGWILPECGLADPEGIVARQVDKIQRVRAPVRSIPTVELEQLFNEAELDSLRSIFSAADKQGTGVITAAALGTLLGELGLALADEEVARLLNELGLTAHGAVTFAHFVKSLYLLQAEHQATAETALQELDDATAYSQAEYEAMWQQQQDQEQGYEEYAEEEDRDQFEYQ